MLSRPVSRPAPFRLIGLLTGVVLSLALVLLPAGPAQAGRDTDSYDGNVFALYAGNGSLVPPANDLGTALADHRVTLLAFYLDDSAASKAFAPVLSELQRLWGRSVELIILPTDPLGSASAADAADPARYWSGLVPQVVVFDRTGTVLFDQSGRVPLQAINAALAEAVGDAPDGALLAPSTSASFNEVNSDLITAP
ncbi:thioredoxin [Synechococcus sp. RSCCF101]|uniref:thylakoid membrane photosystem I accumulation factor n=1 Tax=Synechococcus sp. RSCCF101 TaxID=2511069 RepID=UPI0012478181|nr:thylakoid membrane photosystem I accumulation factor [Synechococcus sp. RSCCF101]QEY31658.1 thioredoxin [Synechococcus sp. RSCCF101]